METISNIASSASKLIYGDPKAESGQEPISGQSGRGTIDSPYDSGNLEGVPDMSGKSASELHSGTSHLTANPASNPVGAEEGLPDRTKNLGESSIGPDTTTTTSSTSDPLSSGTSTNPLTSTTNPLSSSSSTAGDSYSSPSTTTTGATTTGTSAAEGGAIRPEHMTPGTGVTSLHSSDPHGQDVRPSESSATSSTPKAGAFGTAEPSVSADPASGARDTTQEQQGGDRPAEAPSSSEELEGVRGKKEEGEDALLKKRDPDDHSGEPLKMHTAGGEGATKAGEVGEGAGQEGGENKEAKGTGEKVVKQSGFKADGGDFDASLPGAGREADRLLEEKGVNKSSGSDAKDDTSPVRHDDESSGGKSKVSVGTKIKEKLHIGSKHKNGE
ncbi:hypothetical protein DIS24_g7704 [Lasiodiplodia hormozganensis]|uniref:Glycine-rich cell wall structural protein 1 n=1 Tax=Lasiodiplodia hormozganensis TaxID=869390 RepID=A0AA40CQZ5_9PEZI|nr:hypothetical protein DIS24_g7704 [Lasiodiplodia hormozganensis]